MSAIEGDFQYGVVVMAPYDAVASLLRSTDNIASWGRRAVACCVAENSAPSDSVGYRRRCVLQRTDASEDIDHVIRENIVAHRFLPSRSYVSLRIAEASETNSPRISCVPAVDLVTTVTVSPVSTSAGNRCFVEWYSTFVCASLADAETTRSFLNSRWARPLVDSLADFALNVVIPAGVSSSVPPKYRKQYEEFEDAVVRLSAEAKGVGLKPDTVRTVERLLDAWNLQCKDINSTDTVVDGLRSELQSRLVVQAEMAGRIALLTAENNRLLAQSVFAQHGVRRPTGNDAAVGSIGELSDPPPAAKVAAVAAPSVPAVAEGTPNGGDAGGATATTPLAEKSEKQTPVKPAPPHVDPVCAAVFAKLEVQNNGVVNAAAIAEFMSRSDPRTDYDVMQEVEARSAARAHGGTTPRQAGTLPQSREEYFQHKATAWMRDHGCERSQGVKLHDFATLFTRLQQLM